MLVNFVAYSLAGFPKPLLFCHQMSGFPLKRLLSLGLSARSPWSHTVIQTLPYSNGLGVFLKQPIMFLSSFANQVSIHNL